jgi:hypothetical protein
MNDNSLPRYGGGNQSELRLRSNNQPEWITPFWFYPAVVAITVVCLALVCIVFWFTTGSSSWGRL